MSKLSVYSLTYIKAGRQSEAERGRHRERESKEKTDRRAKMLKYFPKKNSMPVPMNRTHSLKDVWPSLYGTPGRTVGRELFE